jgi:4a-hydroxytetrahydrobiopterin dehydratase
MPGVGSNRRHLTVLATLDGVGILKAAETGAYHRVMPYAPLLREDEIATALADLPDWTREGEAIVRAARCPSFRAAIELVNAVADAAETADHHPDMEIVWRRVTFRLTSKASGGLTARDIELARRIDELVPAEPAT